MRAVRRRRVVALLVLLVVTATLVAVDVAVGQAFALDGLMTAIARSDSAERQILLFARLPRVATALVAGFALGITGFALQSALHNPLVSSDVVGVTGGAVVGVLVGSLVASGAGSLALVGYALAGGLMGGALLVVLGRALPGIPPVVIGLGLSALYSGITVLVLVMQYRTYGEVVRWLVGSVSGQSWPAILVTGGCVAAGSAAIVAVGPAVGALAGGAEHAAAVGVGVARARGGVLAAVLLTAAAACALAGPFAFAGIVAGAVARRLLGAVGTPALVGAGLAGAALLCACDALAQLATSALSAGGLSDAGVPAGAVCALAGAAALVLVTRSEGRPT